VIGSIALVIALFVGLLPSTPAMASRALALNTQPYEAWGNNSIGNCPFAALANLVRMHWAHAPITTNEVVRDWRTYNDTIGPLPFMFEYGLGGHTITSYAPVTSRASFIKAANTGGALAVILGGEHSVAVVGASSKGVYFVTWGVLLWVSWAGWNDLDPVSADAITWAPASSSTSTVMYLPECGTLPPAMQSEPTGSTAALTPPAVSYGGVKLLGWQIGNSTTLLQSGQSYAFSGNVVMTADWTLEDVPAGTVCTD
jgi:hypothetical protein